MDWMLALLITTQQEQLKLEPSIAKASEAWEVAAADCAKLPPALRIYTRYYWTGYVAPRERHTFSQAMDVLLNHTSRQPILAKARRCSEMVWAVNTLEYGPKHHDVWEKLRDQENYFHLTEVTHEKKKVNYTDGTSGTKEVAVKNKALAPWIPTEAAAYLVKETKSKIPIVRADWLFWQMAADQRRTPGYHDFLGFNNEKEFEELIGFDRKLAKQFGRSIRAVAQGNVVSVPGIRRVDGDPAAGGPYFRTKDSAIPIDKKNPVTFLTDDFEYEASETIGVLPNGMFAYGLFNAKGERQDVAPPDIASDSATLSSDRQVQSAISCLRCHLANSGFNPIQCFIRGGKGVQSPDPIKQLELKQLYGQDLEPYLDGGRRQYARAITSVTSEQKRTVKDGKEVVETVAWNPKDAAEFIGQAYYRFDREVDLETAAREYELQPDELVKRLRYHARGPYVTTPMAAFITEPPRTLSRRIFEEHYGATRALVAQPIPQGKN